MALRIPVDKSQPISFLNSDKSWDVSKVTVDEIKNALKQKSNRRNLGIINQSAHIGRASHHLGVQEFPQRAKAYYENSKANYNDFSEESSVELESDFESEEGKK